MKGTPPGFHLIVLALVACGGDDGSNPEGDLPIGPAFEALAAQIESERVAADAPGVAALLIDDGEVVFAHGFGTKQPSGGDPVTASTLFRIGSVTKMLTAAAILQHEASGDVALDDPITAIIPELTLADPEWAPTIRIEHLLTHSSGIVDYLEIDAAAAERTDQALDEVLTGRLGQVGYLMAPSGRMWNYSNPNFYVLGLALERLSNQLYVDAMTERLLVPLGMTRTLFRPEEVLADGDYASGRSEYENDGVIDPDSYENPWARPAGYAFSSVWDLSRFAMMLIHGNDDILPASQREAMSSPQIDTEIFDSGHYGYGLFVDDALGTSEGYFETRIISHGGDIPGFAASFYIHADSGLAFITLASADGAHFNETAAYVMDHFADLPAAIDPPEIDTSAEHLAGFVGEFVDPFNAGRVVIEAGDSGLTISMPDVDEAGIPYQSDLPQVSERSFVLTIQGIPLLATFILDQDGNVEYFRTRAFVAQVSEAEPTTLPVRREAFIRALRAAARPSTRP
jgi:CubicO group peptidase (beta-lactamase class C family)